MKKVRFQKIQPQNVWAQHFSAVVCTLHKMKGMIKYMKRIKRILAAIGALLLIALYVSTLIFALIGNDLAINLLKASVALTICLPVMLYAIYLIYRLLSGNHPDYV